MSETRGSSGKYGDTELRRGPWTLEEDTLLIHYIACHGEGRWNLLARTDNEIKNYWRTRVQKQARQLKVDANSSMFRDAVRCYWMPRLLEKMGSSHTIQSLDAYTTTTATTDQAPQGPRRELVNPSMQHHQFGSLITSYEPPAVPESRSPSNSSCSTVLPRVPVTVSEFPSTAPDELDGVAFDPLSSGLSMNNAYGLGTWDLAPVSAPALGYSASPDYTVANSDCSNTIVDGLWTLDELCDMLKSYISGADPKVPFGDNS
ncbi:hypothetical protein BHE74_00054186 [Ensete ventricosum]|nr:hypothetical protein BHE74_00054186 [Ensete ventricosum]RZS23232.1 hypothetical protein BHM03_00056128 [Ensete ventricosum]